MFPLTLFLRQKSGSVATIFAVCLVPLSLVVGMGIDYSRAMKLQTKLNAAADAAAGPYGRVLDGHGSRFSSPSAEVGDP